MVVVDFILQIAWYCVDPFFLLFLLQLKAICQSLHTLFPIVLFCPAHMMPGLISLFERPLCVTRGKSLMSAIACSSMILLAGLQSVDKRQQRCSP